MSYVRYFAATDADPTSALGKTALAWVVFLQALDVDVRLVSQRVAQLQVDGNGRTAHAWDKHRELLLTPMDGPCLANVVCVEPNFWRRLFTPKYRNVLIASEPPPAEYLEDALKYGTIVVPDHRTSNCFESEAWRCEVMIPTLDKLDDARRIILG